MQLTETCQDLVYPRHLSHVKHLRVERYYLHRGCRLLVSDIFLSQSLPNAPTMHSSSGRTSSKETTAEEPEGRFQAHSIAPALGS